MKSQEELWKTLNEWIVPAHDCSYIIQDDRLMVKNNVTGKTFPAINIVKAFDEKFTAADTEGSAMRCGSTFFFVDSQHNFRDITPANITRLFYLMTYMNYENRLICRKQRKPGERQGISVNDLQRILNISRPTAKLFCNDVLGKYLKDTDDGLVLIDKGLFRVGNIGGSFEKRSYRKINKQGMRAAYQGLDYRAHKFLGYFLAYTGLVNIYTNEICSNPFETVNEMIDRKPFGEFAEEVNQSGAHISRFKSSMENLYIDIFGEKQKLVAFEGCNTNAKKLTIRVNPNIFYNADALHQLPKFKVG